MDSNMKSVLRNYVQKCGEGRGLEKFLRRNSYSSGDERDTTASITTSKSKYNKTKSLESLNEAARQEVITTSSPKSPKTPPKKTEPEGSKHMEPTKVVVKQTSEKVDKKKSFNYESIIEITLPQQPAQQSQSMSMLQADQSKDRSETIEEPIKPIICTPKQSKIPLQAQTSADKRMSPSSGNDESFVSNKQNPLMEWDSFIPGYETETSVLQTNNMQLCNPMELDDNELNALKTYFQQRGLQLPNENLVVVIKNRQEKVLEKQFENIRRNKEKWQNIYEKYKEKYQVSTLSFQDPGAQSTPKIVEPSVSKISEPPKSIPMEKGSQTSLVKNAVKSTQVETNCLISKEQTTLDEKTQEQLEMYPSEIAESFEFVRGSKVKESKKKSLSESSGKFDTKKSISTESEAASSKNSGISMSVKNESVANFDDSLKVAIALLNSLLESSMRPELKRNLAEKVIQKIVQLQTSRSIQTSTLESSEIYPQSNSSADPSVKVKSAETKSSHKNREEVLKNCFQPMTKSEISHQNSQADEEEEGESIKESNTSQSIPKSQLVDFVRREKQTQLKWIEKEIEHLNNLRMLLKRNETPLPTPIYENMTGLRNKPLPPEKPLAAVPSDANVWNSHVNMKKVKNRSKLETPVTHDESLASFIDTKNKKFLEKYNKHQKQMYEEINAYTRPYSSKPPTTIKSKRTQLTANKDVQTSTSLASSSVFESDASMSVPMTSSTNSQQQSQPENKKKEKQKVASAVTQTTDSICRTKPIYEVRSDATVSTVTRRVQKLQNDKQLQCHPPSIKYTLTFDKKNKPNVRQYSSLPQRSQYATITKSSKDMYNQISYSASLNYERYVENKENYNDILLASDNGDDVDEVEDIDLRKCFNQNRPEVFTRFEERKKCIEELKKLRALRNEHRAKLLLLTSEKSLEGKLFSSLPDLPLKTTRIFSTKAIKQHTKKVVKNLTEVQQRKKEENLKNLKRKTRLMTEIFNKNLQKNVLKGNLNLSNTVNLIAK